MNPSKFKALIFKYNEFGIFIFPANILPLHRFSNEADE